MISFALFLFVKVRKIIFVLILIYYVPKLLTGQFPMSGMSKITSILIQMPSK